MAWKKVSQALSDFLANSVAGFTCQKKIMFGCPAYFVNGNMFTGVHQDTLFLRLAEPERRQLLAEFDEAAPFEPMPGMMMKEYIAVPEALYHDSELFQAWLRRSYHFVATLPKKKPKDHKSRRP